MDFNRFYFTEGELPELLVLIGIPGSGKSTWIAQNNISNKYRVVSPDKIRKELTGDINDQTKNAEVWKVAKQRVVNTLKNGKSAILDATMTNPEYRQDFIKGLPTSNIKAKIFQADPEDVKERIKKDIEAGKDRANVPDEIVDQMYNELVKYGTREQLEKEGFEVIK